ncbi:MAG: Serine/threonine-protein kinase PrkC [Planctomycetota bacterium]|jgi:serine/threonine protein kinase
MSQPDPHREQPRFRENALASGLVDESQLATAEAAVALDSGRPEPDAWDQAVADRLVRDKTLTKFQARELLAGRRRFRLGQYTVLDELARGGMGQVFRAEHAMMGREVAVKVLPRAKSTPESEAAFRREMRMLGRLDHENLVRAYDAGYDAMVYYLVTEFVPGLDLKRQVLKHGPLDEPLAASVISQAARGLAYAHDRGLVHRDVKPGNIMVLPDGRAKVLDMGLAGSQLEEESSRLGRVVGTMDYIAPEQIRTPDDVGPSADIYALGCTLYFAVTGRVPFPGGSRREKMQRHLAEPPPPVGQLAPLLSAGFCRVIDDMMAKDPARRIQSAGEVVERLRRWMPATLPPMPRRKRGQKGADAESGSEPASSVDDASRGSWLPWPSPKGPDDESLWPTLDADDQPTFQPPSPRARPFLPLAAIIWGSLQAAAAGIAVAAAIWALEYVDPAGFDQLPDVINPALLGWLTFGLAFGAKLMAARRGGH